MTIKLSKPGDDEAVVFKNLIDETDYTAELMNTDMLYPVLKLASEKKDFTYCRIPDFHGPNCEDRCYFVTDIDTLPGGHIIIHCAIDVLMSYREQIKDMLVYVSRNEYEYNLLLNDPLIPLSADRRVVNKQFGIEMKEEELGMFYLIGIV